MSDPVLYEHPLSPYAQKCKIALHEKGVAFSANLPMGIGSGSTSEQSFADVSPRGEVPALIHGGAGIFDSTIILEYIEEQWPAPSLLPKAAADRARVRMLEDVMDTQYEPINWGLGEVQFFQRAKGQLAETIFANARKQCATWHRYLEGQLGERTWFNGEQFGWGDLSVVPYLNGSLGFEIAPPSGSRLADWLERANARPSVAQTRAEAEASIVGMEAVSDIVEQGLMKREYRDHRLEWMIRTGGLQVILDGLEKDNIRFNSEFE